MIGKKPPEKCDRKGYPCDQLDCEFYREWGFIKVEQSQGKHHFWERGNGYTHYVPHWVVFGVYVCQYCKHFKGFDLKEKAGSLDGFGLGQ